LSTRALASAAAYRSAGAPRFMWRDKDAYIWFTTGSWYSWLTSLSTNCLNNVKALGDNDMPAPITGVDRLHTAVTARRRRSLAVPASPTTPQHCPQANACELLSFLHSYVSLSCLPGADMYQQGPFWAHKDTVRLLPWRAACMTFVSAGIPACLSLLRCHGFL